MNNPDGVTMTSTHSNRWLLLLTVGAGLLLITLDNSVLYTALPTLTRELGASAAQGLWIINAYPLVMAGLLLGAGTLGDRVGHRRMFLVGLVLFGLASLFAAFAPSAEALIAARAFLAVGAAAMMPATLALIRVTFEDERERNIAIAIWGSLSVIGAALGPIVGGFLLGHFWWGSVFLINVPVVVLAFFATLVVAPKIAGDPSQPWDIVSSLQALVALSALVIAIKEMAHAGSSWVTPVVAFGVAVVAATVFTRRQFRMTYPLLDFSIFRNNAFLSGTFAAAFSLFAIGGVELATTQRFQLVEGWTPLDAGLLVSVAALGSLPTAILGGAVETSQKASSRTCGYTKQSGMGDDIMIHVLALTFASEKEFHAFLVEDTEKTNARIKEQLGDAYKPMTVDPAPEVGQPAYYVDPQLLILKGGRVLGIVAADRKQATEVAAKALPRF